MSLDIIESTHVGLIARFVSTCTDGMEPSERNLRESNEADLEDPRFDTTSAGHEASPAMTGLAAAAGDGANTPHTVFLAAALAGSAPSAGPCRSRRAAAGTCSCLAIAGATAAAADCAGAATPADSDIMRRGFGLGVLGREGIGGENMGKAAGGESRGDDGGETGDRKRLEQCGGGRLCKIRGSCGYFREATSRVK
jgi:hypothetical protein